MGSDRCSTGGLAEDHDSLGIAAELCNVRLHPPQRLTLVLAAVASRRAGRGAAAQRLVSEKSKDRDAIVSGDEDDVLPTRCRGFAVGVHLSVVGGAPGIPPRWNEDDDGRADSSATWWANLDEVDSSRQYRSETQNLLQALPATTGNLRRIEDAATRDLAWFVQNNIASSVTVSASIPGLNKIKLTINIEAVGEESSFEFVENWKASA